MTDATDTAVILTVDDDPIILNAILEVLKHDYAVRPFTSGQAALSYLKNNTADLILLDHNMPNMTGLEVLQVLQDDPSTRSIPVIFLTGSVDSEDEVRALEIGAMDYLLKPFRPGSLLTRVRLQLELYRHRHHLEELVESQTTELRSANQKLEKRDKITIDLLAKASDMRDHETGAHIERVVLFTNVIVNDLLTNPHENYEISEQNGRDIIDAVKLHDLGKLAMPDNVLLKPGKLTDEEFRIIKTHPIYGSKMLDQAIEKMGEDTLLWTAFEIVYGHHEKWNGTGYPNGTKGFEIPLSARIAAVADVFDALTSERPYKRAWSPQEAFELIYADAGKHFDPYLAEIVQHHEDEFAQIVVANRDDRTASPLELKSVLEPELESISASTG
ncbi:MAG: response regulator [Coriobacteriales bacterium]|jgi:putative two-component system response regulator|nr:response regulator [Coriobacteriales bacterium]